MRCGGGARQARKKELETKAALWDDRGSKLQRELAALREENMRLTHNMQARPEPYPRASSISVDTLNDACSRLQLEQPACPSHVWELLRARLRRLVCSRRALLMHSCQHDVPAELEHRDKRRHAGSW